MSLSQYYPISQSEMETFLGTMNFKRLPLEKIYELVYGCRIHSNLNPQRLLTLRVYTGISLSGFSRKKGSDAIRLVVFEKLKNGVIKPLKKFTLVRRTQTWERNLQNRINEVNTWAQSLQ